MLKLYKFIIKHKITIIYLCTPFLMIIFRPGETIFHLGILLTIYFIYTKQYKDIFILYVFFFFCWYWIFMSLFIDFPFDHVDLKFGDHKHTGNLVGYAVYLYNDTCLEAFCLETIFLLHIIAERYDTVIYLPSIFNGLGFLFKSFWSFIFNTFLILCQWLIDVLGGDGTASCSPSEVSKSSSYPSPGTSPSDIKAESFFNQESSKDLSVATKSIKDSGVVNPKLNDYEVCRRLNQELEASMKSSSIYESQKEKIEDKNFVSYRIKVPYFSKLGLIKGCTMMEGWFANKFFKDKDEKNN